MKKETDFSPHIVWEGLLQSKNPHACYIPGFHFDTLTLCPQGAANGKKKKKKVDLKRWSPKGSNSPS